MSLYFDISNYKEKTNTLVQKLSNTVNAYDVRGEHDIS
jgi:hypothetical protein